MNRFRSRRYSIYSLQYYSLLLNSAQLYLNNAANRATARRLNMSFTKKPDRMHGYLDGSRGWRNDVFQRGALLKKGLDYDKNSRAAGIAEDEEEYKDGMEVPGRFYPMKP